MNKCTRNFMVINNSYIINIKNTILRVQLIIHQGTRLLIMKYSAELTCTLYVLIYLDCILSGSSNSVKWPLHLSVKLKLA